MAASIPHTRAADEKPTASARSTRRLVVEGRHIGHAGDIPMATSRHRTQHRRAQASTTRRPDISTGTLPEELSRDGRFEAMLDALASRTDSVHVHIDLDVISLSDGRANEFAADDGPPLGTLEDAIRSIARRCPISSVSLTSYNPASDADGQALQPAMRLLRALGEVAPEQAERHH